MAANDVCERSRGRSAVLSVVKAEASVHKLGSYGKAD